MKNTRPLILAFILFTTVLAFSFPLAAHAIPLGDAKAIATTGGLFICRDAGLSGFSCILTTVLRILLSLAFILAIIFVVISGYRFITSQGNEQAVTKAKQNLTWAIIGIVLITVAWVLLSIIVGTVQSGKAGTLQSQNNNAESYPGENQGLPPSDNCDGTDPSCVPGFGGG